MWSCNVKKETEKRILSSNDLCNGNFYFQINKDKVITDNILLYRGLRIIRNSNKTYDLFIIFRNGHLPEQMEFFRHNDDYKYQLVDKDDIDFELNITLKNI